VYPTVREALFYTRGKAGKVKCNLCERRCEIAEGKKGLLKKRKKNIGKK
jgi:pyruvate formate lyase activating enzyme